MRPSGIKLNYYAIYSGDESKILRDLSLSQYYHTEEDSDSDSVSDVSRVLSEASSISSYQLRKKDKAMKNIVRRNDVFHTQQLEEFLQISKKYKECTTSDRVTQTNWTQLTKTVENKRKLLLHSMEPVTGNSKKSNINPIKQQTERCVKITNNQREFSSQQKRSSHKKRENTIVSLRNQKEEKEYSNR